MKLEKLLDAPWRLFPVIGILVIASLALPEAGHSIGGTIGNASDKWEPLSPFVAVEIIPGELFSVNARKCEYAEDIYGKDRFDCSSAFTAGVQWIGRNHKILKTEGIVGRFCNYWSPSCPTVTTALLVYVEKRPTPATLEPGPKSN